MIQSRKDFSLFWFLFLLTEIFPPMFLPLIVRLGIALIWIMVAGFRFPDNKYYKIATVMLFYSFLVFTVNLFIGQDVDSEILLRYFRCLLMVMAITGVCSRIESDSERYTIMCTLTTLFIIHSAIIVGEILYPDLKEYMYVFSGQERIFYRYRANGFVNSFDYAGMYTIIGIVLNGMFAQKTGKKRYILGFLLCTVATIFTSRTNMFFAFISLIYVFRLSKRHGKNRILNFIITFSLVAVGGAAILMWAITTDLFPGVREQLFLKIDWMNSFYITIRNTYSDNSIAETIMQQFMIDGDTVFKIFGTGMNPDRDPGYIQILYSTGLIGLIILASLFFTLIIEKTRFDVWAKHGVKDSYASLASSALGFALAFEIAMNWKILLWFSTGAFEILIILASIMNSAYKNIEEEKNG